MSAGMSVAISPSVCTLLSNGPIRSCESFSQLHCAIQNKHLLISSDLTINSCREFEFTIKAMNALLSERFTHHQSTSTCYSQLQQLKVCTTFPITIHNMSSYSVGYSLGLEHTSCAQCQLKWWMMMMIMIDDDGDGCWWIMMMDHNG